MKKVPKSELTNRMSHFLLAMDKACPEWELCGIIDGMSLYYLTGAISDGILMMERGKGAVLWVRRNYYRATLESEFQDIRQMKSFREVRDSMAFLPKTLYLDMAAATLQWYSLFSKYLKFNQVLPIDNVMWDVRSVKSEYEIGLMRQAGEALDRLLSKEVPALFSSGISEAELGAEVYPIFIRNGHHGLSRFATMRNADMVLGHIGFGATPLYPSAFTGASGTIGLCPAAPVLGSREVKLKDGDLVYLDIGLGIEGYNADKTMVYTFGRPQPEYVEEAHNHCLALEKQAAGMLRPGKMPSEIYHAILECVRPEYRDHFMGMPGSAVSFLGHGVGLYVDEKPVLAKGFDKPLELGMTIAIEPKIAIEGVGMVGSENTYLVTESGGESLTGRLREIVPVDLRKNGGKFAEAHLNY